MIGQIRAWGQKYVREGRYTPVGIAFHWVMAALILFQLGWGFWADLLMPGGDKLRAYEIHAAVGLAILILAMGRFAWRGIIGPGPVNDADVGGWKSRFAHLTAIIFYVLFFTLPLSGWAMWSAIAPPGPLYVGGLVPWPQMPFAGLEMTTRMALLDLAEDIHFYSIIVLLALLPAHVGAALAHHFWWRHDVLSAMLPRVPDEVGRRTRSRRSGSPRPSLQGTDAG